ncbi:MAG TPA: phosphotransferase [Candidatus Saccharimonadales bacterium]|nr:phosphotransferase [Candidatus Saccharimonadales bacterium]
MKTSIGVTLAQAIKHNYKLLRPSLITPEDGLGGQTFIIIDGEQRYTAKLYTNVSTADEVARFQDILYTASVPVPAVIANKSGNLVTKLDGGGLVVSVYADGLPIGWSKEFASISRPISFAVAETVARMHKAVMNTGNKTPLDHRINVDRMIRTDNKLAKDLSTIDLSDVRRTMIHGDLTRENILLNRSMDSVAAIIDFGDAHYDYVAFDIATMLTQVYVTKSWGIDFQGITNFLAKYNETNELNEDELKAVLPLMEGRNRALKKDVSEQIASKSSDLKVLQSIEQSIESKLKLLETNRPRLEALIIKS